MKTICWALSFVTCFAFLTGLFLLPMDYAVAKKVGKVHKEAAHKEAVHKEAAHKEAVHKEAVHKEAVHKEAAHGEATHKEKLAEDKGNKEKSTNALSRNEADKIKGLFGEGKGHDKHPPGWNKGNKVGWGDGDMPPGLSRKGEGGKSKSKGKGIEEHIKEKIEEVLKGK